MRVAAHQVGDDRGVLDPQSLDALHPQRLDQLTRDRVVFGRARADFILRIQRNLIRTRAEGVGDPVLLTDAHGPVAVYGLPYLEPALVKDEFGVDRASHEAVLAAAMDRVRADLVEEDEWKDVKKDLNKAQTKHDAARKRVLAKVRVDVVRVRDEADI